MVYATTETLTIDSVDTTGVTESTSPLRGALDAIGYVPDGSNPYGGTATLSVSVDRGNGVEEVVMSAVNITAAAWFRPRAAVHGSDGAAVSGVRDLFHLCEQKVNVTVTDGGNGNTGTFILIFKRP